MASIARVAAHVSLPSSFSFHRFPFIMVRWMVLYVPQALVSRRAAREILPCRLPPWTYVLLVSIFPLPLRFSRQRELESGAMARRSRLYEIIALYFEDPQTGIRRPLCRRETMVYSNDRLSPVLLYLEQNG